MLPARAVDQNGDLIPDKVALALWERSFPPHVGIPVFSLVLAFCMGIIPLIQDWLKIQLFLMFFAFPKSLMLALQGLAPLCAAQGVDMAQKKFEQLAK